VNIMNVKPREPFKIIHGGLVQSNSSMATSAITGATDDVSNTSMMGENGRLEKDDWFDKVCLRLADIDNLRLGWDGYGSDKFAKTTVNFAAMLLATVWSEASALPFPMITPMSNGAIMIEWRSPTHELTVEVNSPNDVDVLFEELATGLVEEFHATSNFLRIGEALEQSAAPARAAVA